MTASTRLRGHGLLGEGKPYWRSSVARPGSVYAAWQRAAPETAGGHGVCECGRTSGVLTTDAARKRWHRAHKADMAAGGEA